MRRMNKKAFMDEAALWIVRILGTLVIIGIIVFLMNSTIERSLSLDDMRFYSVAQRLLYSDCFVLEKENRPYPGIIDLSKFTGLTLDNCMGKLKYQIGAKVILHVQNKDTSVFFNKEYYDDLAPLSFSKDYILKSKRYYVLVDDGKTQIPGNLYIEVAWKK